MGQRPLSRREQEERRKKEEEQAAANVWQSMHFWIGISEINYSS